MLFRSFRIRFIIIRSCIISLIIILFFQIITFLKNENIHLQDINIWNKAYRLEKYFWKNLLNEDKDLTDEQRIKRIELIKKQNTIKEFNWTNIFFDSYTRKLNKVYEKNIATTYKYRFKDRQPNVSQEIYEVFEETLVFERPKFCSSARVFHPQCPYSNCRWSCENPSMNDKNIRRASVFHHVDMNETEMHRKLQHRSYTDIWILWIDEANRSISHLNQYNFNWTLSYRQDSEVSIGTYGVLIPQDKNKFFSNDNLYNNSNFLQLFINRNIPIPDMTIENRILFNYRYRHKHALWYVSNCGPKRRLKYYTELKNYYPIKAFGSCVENKCDKNKQCEGEQSYLALFYLSFESQTCKDYITEKFWRALYYGMIPIVLGPSKQSYLDLGIPQSAFIHVDDFPSAKLLASYLHTISNDYFLYRKYFQWLNQYEAFFDINVLEPIRMCELCMRLNMQEYQEHSYYRNIHEWHRISC
ncbi:unnamed protein product [Adineta steineri]|uniref:Fucosyltransferase n=1 Tax=Adineta steineri TaxID=433720 RepID=A0A819PM56_9BILA|nr:unnamed protein product [Adineta steineri]CAF4015605.1 unnamed protein product [Adineta steineri]